MATWAATTQTVVTAIRDAGVRDLFEKDRDFKRASYFPAGEDDVGVPARNRICKFFERELKRPMERDDFLRGFPLDPGMIARAL